MSENMKRVGAALTIKGGDQFNKTLADTQNSLKLTKSELKLAGESAKTYGTNTKTLGEQQKALQNHTKNLTDKCKLYNDSIKKNTTELSKNKSDLTNLGNEKQKLNSQIKEATKQYGAESQEVKKLKGDLANVTKEYKSKEQQLKNNVRAINNHSTELNKTEAELVGVKGQLQQVNMALADSKSNWIAAGDSMENIGKSMQTVGDKASKVGGAILTLTAPLSAFGVYSAKVGIDFERSMSTVQSLSGATGTDLQKLEDAARKMGRETSKSATDSAEALQFMSLAGWDVTQMLEGLEPILRLSEISGESLGRTSDLVTDSMAALGVQTKDLARYLDVVAKSQASSNTTASAMLEAYIGVGGTLKNMGVPLEESAALIGVLANRGIKGSEAGNSLNSVLINLMAITGQAAAGMGELGVSMYDADGNFRGIEVTLQDLKVALRDCTDEQRDQFTAMIGGKTQMDTLNALLSGMSEEYQKLKGTVNDSSGALLNMAEVMQDNTKGNMDKLKSNLESLGITFSEHILPHVNRMIEGLNNLVTWFGNLDPKIQNSIVTFGLMSVATGGTLKAVGGLTRGLGGLVEGAGRNIRDLGRTRQSVSELGNAAVVASSGTRGVGALTTGIKVLGKSLPVIGTAATIAGAAIYTIKEAGEQTNATVLKSTDEMGRLEKALNKLTGTTTYSRDELEQLGYAHAEYKDVSEETIKILQDSEEQFRTLGTEIDKVSIDGLISEDESQGVINRTSSLCTGIIGEIQEREKETLEAWGNLFNVDGIVDDQENRILETMKNKHQDQIKEVNNKNARIAEIMTIAAGEQRGITEAEQGEMDRLIAELNAIAIDNFKLSEEEKLKVKETYLSRSKNLDLQGLSDLLGEQAKKRDEAIELTTQEYDGRIQELKRGAELLEGEDRIFADRKIQDLERDKQLAIENENDKYREWIKVAQENNPQLLAELDKLNGDILTNGEKAVREQVQQMANKFTDLEKVTETGMYRVQGKNKGAWSDVYVDVDNVTGEIIALWDTTQNTITGKPAIAKVEEYEGNIRAFGNAKSGWIDTKNKIEKAPAQMKLESHKKNTETVGTLNQTYFNAKNKIEGDSTKAKVEENSGNDNRLEEARRKWNSFKYDIESNPIQSTVVYNENRQGGATKYDLGTANSVSGWAMVNESGYELFNKEPLATRSIGGNEYAYLQSGTRIQTHATSVASMKREVAEQLAASNGNNGFTDDTLKKLAKLITENTKEINFKVDNMNFTDNGSKATNISAVNRVIKGIG